MPVIDKNKTHVRRYQEKDIAFMVMTACQEIPKLPHYLGITPVPERLKFLFRNALADENTIMSHLLVNDNDEVVGGVAGYCVTCVFSNDKVCNDLFLYVMPEWRSIKNVIKLIDSYKAWAKRRQAKIIGATHTGGYRSDSMDILLIKNGFERVGALYYLKQGV